MGQAVFIIAMIVAILIFALVGFISVVRWLVRPTEKTKAIPQTPSLSADVAASRRLIDHLRSRKEISASAYLELRQFLDKKFEGKTQVPARQSIESASHRGAKSTSTTEKSPTKTTPTELTRKKTIVEPASGAQPGDETNTEIEPRGLHPPEEPREAIIVADTVSNDVPTVAAGNSAGSERTKEQGQTVPRPATPAPWDLPDPPVPKPRRSFAELMSGFMQEKNMRWGELTSGILIVLSAVGLVVSLRDELSVIPYFSALLFMLITAGIHGAGIYTLRKWKLRSTSRGALVIGLLLVPLNFVAACVLSDQRELNDPMLWIALVIGATGFSMMTWWSSKHLVKRGNLPMVLAIMGSGIATLLLNRTIDSANSSLQYLVFSIPVVVSFLIGTCTFDRRQWVRERWTTRASNRLFLFLGLSVFAAISALSIIFVRTHSTLFGLVAISPIVSTMSIVTSWLGSIVFRGSLTRNSRNHALTAKDWKIKEQRGLGLTGLTLKVLGLALLAVSLIASASNPIVFVANTMLSSIGLIAMFVHQKDERLIPVAWGILALGSLATLNLTTGIFRLDQLASAEDLKAATINGKSGLCLLLVGVVTAFANRMMSHWIPELKDPRGFVIRGWITGGTIFLVGCTISLTASLLNRENIFDVMVASGLLLLAAVGLLLVCVAADRGSIAKLRDLPHYAAMLLLGGLAHSMLWNLTVGGWIDALTGTINAAWVALFAIHAVVLIGFGWFLVKQNRDARSRVGVVLTSWGAGSALVVSLGALTLIPSHSGWATFFVSVACGCWILVGWVWHQAGTVLKRFAAAPFVLTTGSLVCVFIADLASQTAWCPAMVNPRHWLVQLIGLSAWSLVWTCFSNLVRKSPWWKWLEGSRAKVDQIVLFLMVFAIGGVVLDLLITGSILELMDSYSLESRFGLDDSPTWVVATVFSIGAAMLASLVARPTVYKGAAMISLWFLAWAMGAEPFGDSKSVASAIRWLLPVGGLVGAVLMAFRRPMMPAWATMRNRLSLAGKSYWDKSSTQQLINFALAIVAGTVLLISTAAGSQFILHGADSLGGPLAGSWFYRIPAEVSFGVPIGMIVSLFLLLSVSEKRTWLATIGSAVFQYFVVLAIVLLFLSPHESLASVRFVKILLAVSLGMTAYGFAWFWMRDRIESRHDVQMQRVGNTESEQAWRSVSQIEIHTILNGLLITSLAILVMGRFFLIPDQPGEWISSVGSLMGVFAWAAFSGLAFCLWRADLTRSYSAEKWVWLVGWMGLILVGLCSAVVDRFISQSNFTMSWLPFRVVMIGTVFVGLVQSGWILISRSNHGDSDADPTVDTSKAHALRSDSLSLALPVLLTGAIGLTFAVRGAWLSPDSFWLYLGVVIFSTIWATLAGWVLRDGIPGFVSAAIGVLGVSILYGKDPHGWFTNRQPDWFNLVAIVLSVLATGWTMFLVGQRRKAYYSRSFGWMPNVVLLGGAVWIFVAAIFQFGLDTFPTAGTSSLANPLGIGALTMVAVLATVSIWNDQARFRVASGCLLSVALVITLASSIATENDWRMVDVMLGGGLVVSGWGVLWLNRAKWFRIVEGLGGSGCESLEHSMRRQLPIYSLIFGGLVLIAALVVIFQFEKRPQRYIAAAVPLMLAVGIGTQSNPSSRRWLQVVSLLLITVGALFVAWADLAQSQMTELPMIRLLVRSLIVLAGSMFVYGGLVARWVRPGDTWLKSLREMAVVTCGLAVLCLMFVITSEAVAFEESVGCGLMMGESITVAILVGGMISGLVIIAMRPEKDPFALSIQGRMGYVYAAEFVGLALIAHIYFSLPWLFQLGIKDYWPYIMMAICFGGVGVARVLETRELTVLGKPLFHTAAALPLIVAIAVFRVHSEANLELVMMTVGLAYLMISYTHSSLLSGAAAIVFGNLALWMVLNRTDFSFIDHPQIWLIPPAISTLIASQLSRNRLPANQLAAIRYVCIATIYVSSTMEVFISGIGENLWPPIVLTILSVIGIMSGIMFRVKSFLYFGSLFLLMSMISMVAHAHQSLGHVWPWWAFGIGLGIAILIMFGLFEKKKNEMKAIAGSLKEWES